MVFVKKVILKTSVECIFTLSDVIWFALILGPLSVFSVEHPEQGPWRHQSLQTSPSAGQPRFGATFGREFLERARHCAAGVQY